MPKVTLGVSVGTWLNTEFRVFYHHMTLLQEDGGWVEGIPETTAELLGPFLALTKVRSHSEIQSHWLTHTASPLCARHHSNSLVCKDRNPLK